MYPVPARRLCALAAALAAAALPLVVAVPASAAPASADGSRTVVGTLLQAYPETAGTTAPLADAPLSWVLTGDGDAVRVPTADLSDVPAGATVQVTVAPAGDPATPRDDDDAAHTVVDSQVLTDPPPAPPQPGPGPTDEVTVVRVVPQGGAEDDVPVDRVVDAVNDEVAAFWSEQTNGAIRLAATAGEADWIHTPAACSDPVAMWDQAADAVGFTPGPGKHLLVYLSSGSDQLPGCHYALGTVGAGPGSGGMAYVTTTMPSAIAHELGHNFGLGHSSGRQCDGTVDTGTCETFGYRDYYDVMGAYWDHLGTLNAAQEARLGVLPAEQQRTLDANGAGGTVPLAPLSGRSGTRALQLTAPDGTDYWLEYRTPTGQDHWLGTPADRFGLQAGVLVRRAGPLPDTSLLLDGTPSPMSGWANDYQDALPVGVPVRLAEGFTVTVQSLTADVATVAVTTTPAVAATTPAAPSSTARPRTLPAHGCSAAACDTTPPTAQPSATTPAAAATTAGAPEATPARPVRVALAASTSPSFVVALAALGAVLVLGGGLLLRLRNGRSRGRRGGRAAG